jgi:hypothetical protein
MKKLTFLLLLIPIFSNAQIRRTEFDSAWARQFILNQNFGANINTLFTNNGDRRKQIESLKIDSANKKRQIDSLILVTSSLEKRLTALEKTPKDTFKIVEGVKISSNKISLDTAFTNKLYAVKDAESSLLQIVLYLSQLEKRTTAFEAKLENAIGRIVLLEAFKAAIKNL